MSPPKCLCLLLSPASALWGYSMESIERLFSMFMCACEQLLYPHKLSKGEALCLQGKGDGSVNLKAGLSLTSMVISEKLPKPCDPLALNL